MRPKGSTELEQLVALAQGGRPLHPGAPPARAPAKRKSAEEEEEEGEAGASPAPKKKTAQAATPPPPPAAGAAPATKPTIEELEKLYRARATLPKGRPSQEWQERRKQIDAELLANLGKK